MIKILFFVESIYFVFKKVSKELNEQFRKCNIRNHSKTGINMKLEN